MNRPTTYRSPMHLAAWRIMHAATPEDREEYMKSAVQFCESVGSTKARLLGAALALQAIETAPKGTDMATEVASLYKRAVTITGIALLMDIDVGAVRKALRQNSLLKRHGGGKPPHPRREDGLRMLAKGERSVDIAEELGVSTTTVQNWKRQSKGER